MADQVVVSAYQTNPDGSTRQALADTLTTGTTVQAASLLAQRVIFQLLLRRGTVLYSPKLGCNFLVLLAGGNLTDDSAIFIAFAASRAQLLINIQAEDESTTPVQPLSNQLKDLRLLQVAIMPGMLIMQLMVVSKAGSVETVNLPLTFPLL